jgi:tetratricopeptide (TPR) repeat protein
MSGRWLAMVCTLVLLAPMAWAAEEPPAEEPTGPAAAAARADGLLRAYKTAEARKALEPHQGVATSDPAVGQAWASVLVQEKKYAEAVKALDAVAKAAPADPEPLLAAGDAQLLLKKTKEAGEAYKKALTVAENRAKAEPKKLEVQRALGVARQRSKQYDKALEAFKAALEIAPDDLMTRYHRGVTLTLRGRFEESVAELTKVIEKDAAFAYAYYYRALAADKLGKKDILVNDMDRFLFLAPAAPEADRARAIVAAAKR